MKIKSLILLSMSLFIFSGCDKVKVDASVSSEGSPFKEYALIDVEQANSIAKGIFETEAKKNGIDLTSSSAHVIKMTKYGSYANGTVRILGELTEEKLKQVQKSYPNANGIISYNCDFEYSYTTGSYQWSNNAPDYLSK